MKLIAVLKKLVLEFNPRDFELPPIIKGRRQIKVLFTRHQTLERFGDADVEDPSTIKTINRLLNTKWVTGIPNVWIYDSIVKNFNEVFETIDEFFDPTYEENKIIFSAPHDQLGEIEFICALESYSLYRKGLLVITSGTPTDRSRFFSNREQLQQIELSEEENKKFIRIRLEK